MNKGQDPVMVEHYKLGLCAASTVTAEEDEEKEERLKDPFQLSPPFLHLPLQ